MKMESNFDLFLPSFDDEEKLVGPASSSANSSAVEQLKQDIQNAKNINTKKSTIYGMKVFNDWMDSRESTSRSTSNIIQMKNDELNETLALFFLQREEERRQFLSI